MYLDFGTLPRPLWVVESDLSLLVDGKVWEVMIGYKSKLSSFVLTPTVDVAECWYCLLNRGHCVGVRMSVHHKTSLKIGEQGQHRVNANVQTSGQKTPWSGFRGRWQSKDGTSPIPATGHCHKIPPC